jgi:membrane protease subunit HflK
MAWNQPGRKPGTPPERSADKPRNPLAASHRDDDPPGLDAALRRLNRIFGIRPARVLLMGLLALLLIGLGTGLHEVGAGDRVLVLRAGRLHDIQAPGLHWNIPLLDRLHTVNVSRLRDARLSADVITRDDGLLTLPVVLHYRVADPEAYLLRFADAEAVLLRLAEAEVQQAATGMTLQELLGGGQAGLAPALAQRVAQRLAGYRSGLALSALELAAVQPPADVRRAFAAAQQAQEEARRELAQARAEQQRTRQAAEAGAARQLAAADKEAARRVALAREQAAQFAAALAHYRQAPAATLQQLQDEAVGDVLARTRTVILGEGALQHLGIPWQALSPAPLPPAPRALPERRP